MHITKYLNEIEEKGYDNNITDTSRGDEAMNPHLDELLFDNLCKIAINALHLLEATNEPK